MKRSTVSFLHEAIENNQLSDPHIARNMIVGQMLGDGFSESPMEKRRKAGNLSYEDEVHVNRALREQSDLAKQRQMGSMSYNGQAEMVNMDKRQDGTSEAMSLMYKSLIDAQNKLAEMAEQKQSLNGELFTERTKNREAVKLYEEQLTKLNNRITFYEQTLHTIVSTATADRPEIK